MLPSFTVEVLEDTGKWPFRYKVKVIAVSYQGVTAPVNPPETIDIDSIVPLVIGGCYNAHIDNLPYLIPYESSTHSTTTDS